MEIENVCQEKDDDSTLENSELSGNTCVHYLNNISKSMLLCTTFQFATICCDLQHA